MLVYTVPLVIAAYILFFLYDWRMVSHKEGSGSMAVFCAACVLVVVAAVLLTTSQLPWCPWDALSFVSLLIVVASGVCMVKALFFSLPANTYVAPEQARPTYTHGMYALCRHPGVLWYCLMFAFLGVMLRTPVAVIGCCVLCIGDVAYMFFQDAWSFPRTFCDYAAYRRSVPLFFPTRASLHAAFATDAPKADGGRA